MLWTENIPVIKIGPKGALGSHEIRPIHSAPSLGQSIAPHTLGHSAMRRGSSTYIMYIPNRLFLEELGVDVVAVLDEPLIEDICFFSFSPSFFNFAR